MRSDEVLIPPARVQIAAILARASEAECSGIRDLADVSDASLSKHLSALAVVGCVLIKKVPRDGRQRTWAALTAEGRRAFRQHARALQEMISAADRKFSDIATT